MKASMELQVDFLVGTSIEDAVEQSIALLSLLPMVAYVEFQFNGLKVAVNRKSRVTSNMTERLSKAYEKKIKHWIVEAE